MPSTVMWCDPAVALVTYSVCREDQSCGTRGLAAARLTGPRSMCPYPHPRPPGTSPSPHVPSSSVLTHPVLSCSSKTTLSPLFLFPLPPFAQSDFSKNCENLQFFSLAPPGTSSRLTPCLVAGSPLGRGDRWPPRVRPGRSGAHRSMGPCRPLLASGQSLLGPPRCLTLLAFLQPLHLFSLRLHGCDSPGCQPGPSSSFPQRPLTANMPDASAHPSEGWPSLVSLLETAPCVTGVFLDIPSHAAVRSPILPGCPLKHLPCVSSILIRTGVSLVSEDAPASLFLPSMGLHCC